MSEPSDDDLMGAMRNGESAAFDAIVGRHRSWVRSLLRSFVGDADLAEDLVQEVFCRVHAHAAVYVPKGQFVAWIKRIAVNVGRTAFTRRKTADLPLAEAADMADSAAVDPTALLMQEAVRQEVRDAVQSLPDDQRLAVVMRYFGAMSVAEIAWAMQCPEGTIRSRIFYGLRRIRSVLDGKEEIDER